MSGGFEPPKHWGFPPFFTLQPTEETRLKQLRLWRELVLAYHERQGLYSMGAPSTFPLFRNDALNRQLSPEGVEAVVRSLLEAREAEWEDAETRTNLLIFWKTPEALAREIAQWAAQTLTKFDSIVPVVDIHNDETSPFYGVDEALVLRALEVLEREGKLLLIDRVGVKFSL